LQIVNFLNGTRPRPGWLFEQSGGSGDGAGSFANESCSPLLREGNSLITSLVSDFVVPEGASAISFEFENLSFDTSSQGGVHDAFEASLLDKSGSTAVRTLSLGGDSFFNITEGQQALLTGDATQVGNKVSLSLASLLPGMEAQLVVRLVNNDSDTETSVLIKSLQIEFAPSGGGGEGSSSSIAGAGITSPSANAGVTPSSGVNKFVGTQPASTTAPPVGAIPGRLPTNAGQQTQSSLTATGTETAGSQGEGTNGSVIDSRGTEFWFGFPDNLFESINTPEKSLHITGDTATTGFVEVPGLIDPDTMLPFRAEFAVNPGEVTAVPLPSNDESDNSNDTQTDFDVEAELVGVVQKLGVHIVALDPVTVYGISRAVNTTDAFLALPVDSLGKEYIDLGYGNTHRLTASPIGSQFLIVATEDETQVQIVPGQYTFATTDSDARVLRPSGTTPLNVQSLVGTDIGPFITDQSGEWSLQVAPPFEGYSGHYRFEAIDVVSAAVASVIGDLTTMNFPTGREAKVVSFDITAGQQLVYDPINPAAPNAKVWLISPSSDNYTLGVNVDQNTFANQFNPLRFQETGTYYLLVVGEQNAEFDFAFRMLDMEQAPNLELDTVLSSGGDIRGQAAVYQFAGQAGQQIYFDSHDDNRQVGFDLLGPGGQLVVRNITATDQMIVLPESGRYYVVLSSTIVEASYAFVMSDVAAAPVIPTQTTTNFAFSDGSSDLFRIQGVAGQTLGIENRVGTNLGRTQFQLYDPAGNRLSLTNVGGNLTGRMLLTGDYTLIVSGIGVADAGEGSFQTSQLADPATPKLGFNSTQTLTIAAGESASYEFTGPAGTPLLIDGHDTASENLNIEVTAPDGSRVFTGFSTAAEVRDIPFDPTFLPQSGTYRITLRGNNPSAAGSYTFRVLDLETFPSLLTMGTPVNAEIATGQETLFFAFDAVAGQLLAVDGTFNDNVPLQLYDPYLQRLINVTVRDDAGTRIVHSGRHYVRIAGNKSAATSVTFSLSSDEESFPTINFGQRVSGTLSPGRSREIFRIQLESGQRIRYESLVTTNHTNSVRIANFGGRVLVSGNGNADQGGGLPYVYVPESGVYFVSIDGGQDTEVSYDFRIDNLDLAPILEFDVDSSITLTPGFETQVFLIPANARDMLEVVNTQGTARNLNWRLVGPNGATIGSDNSGLNFTATAISSGTYYLVISGRDANPVPVSFHISRIPGANPGLTGLNEQVDLQIGVREIGRHQFTVPFGQIVYFNVIDTSFAIPAHSITLQQGETYLLQDQRSGLFNFNPDLTGTQITSDNPIAVLAGNRCAFVPTQFSACDHLVEQLPATNT
ncbi:MAG: IgGFc-binding protein, partial [Planctomycetales bacterium]|nr:IgGFc-binding protein [Planctomycetales bacterium]